MIRPILILTTIILIIMSCNPEKKIEAEKQQLMDVDRAFSQRSLKAGNHQAFLDYAMSDAVLLKPNHLPIIGRAEIKRIYEEISDSSYVLTWEPSFARVSKSCDLGYTFGVFQQEFVSGEEKGNVYRGTYTTIWAKNKKGKWRFVLDTGNSGLDDSEKE